MAARIGEPSTQGRFRKSGKRGSRSFGRGVKTGTPECLGNQVAGDPGTPLARCLALEADRPDVPASDSDVIDPHRAYRVAVRVATPSGGYAGRWAPWRNAGPAEPYSLPAVSGLSAFWNAAYQGRLAVRWDGLPGATGYHVTISMLDTANKFSNWLVALHHTGTWLLVTDRAQGLQLCPGRPGAHRGTGALRA